jgi:hypothetical protein
LHQDIKGLPEFSEHHALDGQMITADPLHEAVGCVNRTV